MPEDVYQLMLEVPKRDLSLTEYMPAMFRDSAPGCLYAYYVQKAEQTREMLTNPDLTLPDPYLLYQLPHS